MLNKLIRWHKLEQVQAVIGGTAWEKAWDKLSGVSGRVQNGMSGVRRAWHVAHILGEGNVCYELAASPTKNLELD